MPHASSVPIGIDKSTNVYYVKDFTHSKWTFLAKEEIMIRKTIPVPIPGREYDITVGEGLLDACKESPIVPSGEAIQHRPHH